MNEKIKALEKIKSRVEEIRRQDREFWKAYDKMLLDPGFMKTKGKMWGIKKFLSRNSETR